MMQSKKTILTTVVFFGALWGLVEATLGYGLQFLPHLVSGSVMFPLGAVILFHTYKQTGSKRAVFMVGVIAASIKAVNFFAPGLPPIKTYNPMIAILMQSLFIVVLIPLFERRTLKSVLAGFLIASIGWRLVFLLNITVNNALTGFPFPQLQSLASMTEFTLAYGLMGAAFGVAFLFIAEAFTRRAPFSFKIRPVTAGTLLVVTLVVTYLTS